MKELRIQWNPDRKLWQVNNGTSQTMETDGMLLAELQEYRNTVDQWHLNRLSGRLRYLGHQLGKKYRWDSQQQRIVEVAEER